MKTLLLKRKQLLFFFLTLTLCVAVFINWYYTGKGNITEKPDTKEEQTNLGEAKLVSSDKEEDVQVSVNMTYFTQAKLKRNAAFDEEKELLTSIISNKDSGEAAVKDAQSKINELIDKKTKQTDIENLITGKLNCECVTIIGSSSCEVLIPEKSLDDSSAVQIKDIILSKTDINAEKISIIGVKNVVEN